MTDKIEDKKPLYSDEVVRILEGAVALAMEKRQIDRIKIRRLKDKTYVWEIEAIGHNVEKIQKIDKDLRLKFGCSDD